MQKEISFIRKRQAGKATKLSADQISVLASSASQRAMLGIGVDSKDLRKMTNFAMDADLTAALTVPSVATPVQFLQSWLPGIVEVITQARKSDELMGTITQGSWEDEEIVQQILEEIGNPRVYGDHTSIPFASWNTNFEKRTIVRFELGLEVTKLEEARAGKMNVNSAEYKRKAVAHALEILRNRIAFFGYNDGANRTFGILNDPELLPYINVPNGVSGNSEWGEKAVLERIPDLLLGFSTLRTQSGDQVDPKKTPITLGVPTSIADLFSDINEFDVSVTDWLNRNYPNVTMESVPEFDGANGGENVIYMYADSVMDSGTDGGQTLVQVVPTKFQSLGVETVAKGYREDYTNATAGVLVKRPFAVVRLSGV